MRMRVLLLALIFTLVVPRSTGCAENRVFVVTTIEPLASIVRYIGSPYVEVDYILPAGADLHSYALTASDVEKLRSADLVVLVNSSFFALEREMRERLEEMPHRPLILDYVNYTLDVHVIPNFGPNFHGIWMWPDNAVEIARAVARALTQLMPDRAEFFKARFEEFSEDVTKLKEVLIETARDVGVLGKKAIVVVPCVAYVVESFGVRVVGTLMLGHGVSVDERLLRSYAEMARRGELAFIACLEHLRGTRVAELAQSFSEDTGLPVVEFRIFSLGGVRDYAGLLLYNAGKLRASLRGQPSASLVSPENSLFVLVVGTLLAVLGALALKR